MHKNSVCLYLASAQKAIVIILYFFLTFLGGFVFFGVMNICINLSSQKLQCLCRTLGNPLQPSDENLNLIFISAMERLAWFYQFLLWNMIIESIQRARPVQINSLVTAPRVFKNKLEKVLGSNKVFDCQC